MKHFDKDIKHIKSLLAEVMTADRGFALRELTRLRSKKAKAFSADKLPGRLDRLKRRLEKSRRRRNRRLKNVPPTSDIDALPITAKKTEIIRAIKQHPVVIVSGETGSGKTTQLPKYCLAAGQGIAGIIGHTQPRRIAAMTVARRIAEEFGQDLGDAVGYKIRFQERSSSKAFVKIMTDGILLAETQTDRYLNAYDTIIVDEAHERSLNIDFILGILQTLLARRDDLKLIITSATIDTEKFSKAFGGAPVIEVSGRMYPVDVRFEKPVSKKAEKNEMTHVERAAQAVRQLVTESRRGDILVFMPTEQDIRDTCELIEGSKFKNARILPLFARLTAAAQARVFARSPERKIIVATNVAETSITIPGIKYVVDSGLARISSYSPRTRTTSLPVVPISRSSADQRKGRCGRVQNGICVRLFAEKDYRSRPLYTRPEILRANLAEVILRMLALRLGDISDFPFIDRPDAKSIRDGYDLLYELGAIRYRRQAPGARHQAKTERAEEEQIKSVSARAVELTEKGRLMARIPLDPRLSRMLLEAKDRGCIDPIAIIAAALSIQDPRERPLEKTAEADQAHAQFDDPVSDFTTLLNIWHRYNHVRQTRKSGSQLKRFCRQNFLSYNRMREWRDIHHQIRSILEEFGIGKRPRTAKAKAQNLNLDRQQPQYQSIHQSILSGYLSNIAQKKEKNVYRATQNREVMVFPGSGLFDRAGRWVVAAEMVETSRLFARTVACIESHWLEALGGDLCRRTHLNPRWQKSQSAVMADEQVSLFGLIVAQRPVPYGPVNPDEAAEIFIRAAIAKGGLKKPLAFMVHNQRLIDDILRLEDRLRRRDLLISEQALFDFYAAKLPGVCSVQMLKDQIKKRGGDRFLRLDKRDLMNYDPDAGELARYPLSTKIKGQRFKYRYRFQPGKDDDGVTIQVPVSLAASVPKENFDWLVPGMIKEKIETLIKGLPKAYRKKLVPVNETVEIIHRELPRSRQALLSALGEFILQRFGVDIPATAWPSESLPDHLKMRISMVAPDGRVLRSGRHTGILLQATKEGIPASAFETYCQKWQRTGITRWDFGDLPEFVSSPSEAPSKWVAYPALQAGKDPVTSVRLTLFLGQDKAQAAHRQGVAGLYKIRFAKDLKILKKGLKLPGEFKAAADHFGGSTRFAQRLLDRVVSDLFCKNIRTQNAFEAHAENVSPVLISTGQILLESSQVVLSAYHKLSKELNQLKRTHLANTALQHFCEELRSALERLVPDTFIQLYDTERLAHIERYIQAMQIRARRALLDFEKDQAKDREVATVAARLDKLLQALSANATAEKRKALEDLYWMIEEYKVSIFAQELKTAIPVSKKRLEKKLAEISRMI